MKFNIYFTSNNELVKLYAINRSLSGLYLMPFGNWPHFSYHNSGETHYRHPALVNGNLNTKRQRVPLQEFIGPESITSFNVLNFSSRSSKGFKVKKEDIVIDLEPPFCVEIILTSKELVLPEMADRKNSRLYLKTNFSPMIIVEAFNLPNRQLIDQRFKVTHPEIL